MTHKKRPSSKKMDNYKHDKLEFARELGFYGSNKTEVNAKMAAQGEDKYSKKTMRAKRKYVNPEGSQNTRY